MNRVQSAVSQAVGRLQRETGVQLLIREASGMRATPAGFELARQGKTILELVERASRDMARFDPDGAAQAEGSFGGSVEIGIVHSLTPVVLRKVLGELANLEPALAAHVSEGLNDDLVTRVTEHGLDLALVWLPVHAPGLESCALGASRLVVVAHPEHRLPGDRPISLAALSEEPWIAYPPGNPARRWIEESCRGAGFSANIRLEVRTLGEAKAFVEAGAGLTILPAASVKLEVAAKQLRVLPLRGTPFQALFGYVWSPASPNRPVRVLKRVLDERLVRTPPAPAVLG